MNQYLYVHYDTQGHISLDLDQSIEKIVETAIPGAERCGSGMGGGQRDLEFSVSERPSYELLHQLKRDVRTVTGTQDVEVTYDAWDEDEELEEDGMSTEDDPMEDCA